MKSDERHELKRNDLAEGITGLPLFWARHGNKVLLAVAAVLLVFTAVRYRTSQAVQRNNETRQALANAWSGVQEVSRYAELPASPEMDKLRGPVVTGVNQAVELVLGDSSVAPTQAAWAWLARGEMYWAIAHAPKPLATTAPSSQPAAASQPADDPTALAANAYNRVINDYAAARQPTLIARFGLAALAEERHDAAAARTQYNAIIETKDVPPADKSLAVARLGKLGAVEKPMLMLPAAEPVVTTPAIGNLPSFGSPLQFGSPLPATTQPTR